ncbi:Trypanosomal VSG domain/Trypanosome variant surface glycoprotein C-terminal domain containing protein, putative [Trypanosoma equiperdum]|uniref:Trypanosomal VSG domain/Trypanosome variant surface glycoprotein C-terminal domain containing protein, putative n=1 Tax=Trypanosoma equiperdum TaxID=5694 RepID=A0A1G4IHB9_TRYEQ|nr:Trypanosomal VSG domain/Trypanosome variant surface glycoprotein C-terminal domain containing protein, putative [Trypanosoma equiperdum]
MRDAIVILIAAAGTLCELVSASETAKGALQEHFHAICRLASIADERVPVRHTPEPSADTLERIWAINLTLAPNKLAEDVIANVDQGVGSLKEGPAQKIKPSADTWLLWQRAAKLLKAKQATDELKQWQRLKGSPDLVTQLRAIAKKAARLHQIHQSLDLAANREQIQKHLTKALSARQTTADKLVIAPTGSDRPKACCGNAADASHNAGISLEFDIVCLCATGQTNGASTSAAACCPGCSADNAKITADADLKATAANLLRQCKKLEPAESISAANIHAAIAAFMQKLAKPTGANNAVNYHFGNGGTNFVADCDGNTDPAKGAGVNCKATDFSGNTKGPKWMYELRQAAEKLTQLESLETQAKIVESAAEELNISLTSLWDLANAAREIPTPTRAVPAHVSEEKKLECAKVEKAADCRKKPLCKWTKETEEIGEHCELNETKVAQETQAGTGGTAGTTTGPNCGQYKDPDSCKNAPGEKKPGKNAVCGSINFIEGQGKVEAKCRDSSFLPSKQIAHSVISAAFVALFFKKKFSPI